jgi:two-component system chemotaxis response regulator CheY
VPGPNPFEKFSVLVVEDNDFIRDLVVSQLRQIGFRHIIPASDGEAAFNEVLQATPSLIVCDINMEPMSGFEFVVKLRRKGLVGDFRIPTVILTAHAMPEFVDRARELEVDAFVVKPVKRDILEQRIVKVMEARKLIQPFGFNLPKGGPRKDADQR